MHPLAASVAILGSLLTALGIVGSSVVIGRVTDQVVLPAFDEGSTVTASDVLWGVVAVLCVAIIRSAGTVMRRYYAGMTTQQVERSLRERLSRYYLELPMEFHQRSMAGRLLAHADNDTMMATNVLDPVPFTLGTFFLMVFAAISLLMIDLLIAAVALLIFPAMYALNRVYTSRIERPTAAVQASVGRVSSVAHESFDGALVVKTLGRAHQESERFEPVSARLRNDRVHVGNIRAVFEAVLDAMPSLGIAAVVLIGAYRIEAGAMTAGELVQVAASVHASVVPDAGVRVLPRDGSPFGGVASPTADGLERRAAPPTGHNRTRAEPRCGPRTASQTGRRRLHLPERSLVSTTPTTLRPFLG